MPIVGGLRRFLAFSGIRGFSLEDTHLQAPERLSLLLALLSLALAWALRSGEWLHQAQPLLIKSHGRRAKSLFRYGVDHLRSYRAQLGSQIRAVFGGGTFCPVLRALTNFRLLSKVANALTFSNTKALGLVSLTTSINTHSNWLRGSSGFIFPAIEKP